MELVFLTIFIFVSVPALLIKLFGEYSTSKKNRVVMEARRIERTAETDLLKSLMPAREIQEEIWKFFPICPFADRQSTEYEAWFSETKKKLFETGGLAEDFRAIYGDTWEEDARLLPAKTEFDPSYSWNLKGFHNSPSGEDLTVRWQEKRAVEALLYAKRGLLPPFFSPIKRSLNVVPYPDSDWNREIAAAWYKRIEELMNAAGKPVRLYFTCPEWAEPFSEGVYFSPDSRRERRW